MLKTEDRRRKGGGPKDPKIKIYTDRAGRPKGDALLQYEDPAAAEASLGWFNGTSINGKAIRVELASRDYKDPNYRPPPPLPPPPAAAPPPPPVEEEAAPPPPPPDDEAGGPAPPPPPPPTAAAAPQAPGSSTPAGKPPPQEGGGADRKKKRRRGPESDQERAARIEKRKAERKAREEAALARLGASRAGILLQEQLERRGQA